MTPLGVVTIATAASAAGDIDSATPTALNTITAGAALNLTVTGGGAESVMQNVGEAIARTPMTPTELLVQALLLSNEFVYVN